MTLYQHICIRGSDKTTGAKEGIAQVSKNRSVWPSWLLSLSGKRWVTKKCELRIRRDNIAALPMGARLKIRSSPLSARGIALLYSRAAHEPRVSEHVPGLSTSWPAPAAGCASQALRQSCRPSWRTQPGRQCQQDRVPGIRPSPRSKWAEEEGSYLYACACAC